MSMNVRFSDCGAREGMEWRANYIFPQRDSAKIDFHLCLREDIGRSGHIDKEI